MLAKRSARQSVAQKVFVRSTKAGNAVKIFREQYLRDDIPCGSQKCGECSQKTDPDFRGNCLPPSLSATPPNHKNTPHYVVVDTNICLQAIDMLEHPQVFHDVIIPHTVLEEVRNRSIPVYSRLRSLTSGSVQNSKRFYVYHNDFSEHTFSPRNNHEKVNDYNDRLIRNVASFYNQHLSGISTIMLSNDAENRKLAQADKIPTSTLSAYIKDLGNPELLDLAAAFEENADKKNDAQTKIYAPHLALSVVLGGLQSNKYHQGKLSTSGYNYLEANVSVPEFDKPLLVVGRENLNRAFDGDKVVVELLPKNMWKKPLTTFAEESSVGQADDDDDQVESVISDKERKLLVEEAKQSMSRQSDGSTLQPTCKVVSILKRNWRFYVGNITTDSSTLKDTGSLRNIMVKPMDRKIPHIRIQTRRANQLANKRIVVAVDDWPVYSKSPHGHFVRELGEIEDHQAETEAILLEHDIEFRPFPQAAMDCLPSEGDKWLPEPGAANRRDLRDLNICSIDPPGCQDIDDALHAHPLPNGNLSVGVHIADVTHFVKADTPLDKEGALRATSTYLVDRRIDMLPSLLGTNLCSLRPYVERYAFSVLWEMTPEGEIVNTEFTKSLIKSKHAFEYTEAQAKIDDQSQQDEIAQGLRLLLKISKILKQKRLDAGALNLASPEIKILLGDEMNDPTSVSVKKAVDTNSLVEEFMLLANITVARKIYDFAPQTAMLRRHGAPPVTNFEVFNDQLRLKGYPQVRTDSSKSVADSLDEIVDANDPYFNTLVRILATRCMMAAEYFAAGDFAYPEFRHYGLATDIYTHFTSPIRRYADVVVHRQLAASINYEKLAPSHFLKNNLEQIVDNINTRHRNAQFAGRASVEYFVGQMLKKQEKSQVLEGYVVKVLSNGISVLVPKYGLESVVHLEDIVANVNTDAEFDEQNYKLVLNTDSGKREVSVFDKINVRVESIKHESTGKRSVKMTLA